MSELQKRCVLMTWSHFRELQEKEKDQKCKTCVHFLTPLEKNHHPAQFLCFTAGPLAPHPFGQKRKSAGESKQNRTPPEQHRSATSTEIDFLRNSSTFWEIYLFVFCVNSWTRRLIICTKTKVYGQLCAGLFFGTETNTCWKHHFGFCMD